MSNQIGNTPLEVMAAIVENGGPVEAWVRYEDTEWLKKKVYAVSLDDNTYVFRTESSWWPECCLDSPKPQTRPMTAREAALFLWENEPCAVSYYTWGKNDWKANMELPDDFDPQKWRYAKLDNPAFPQWRDFPEVECD